MTSDITCDATVKYIIDNEQHLDLAFRVEEAMPIVRKRLIEEVKCLVEKVVEDVKKEFCKRDCWKVLSTYDGDVMEGHRGLIVLRKNGWYEHGNENPPQTGIHLSSDQNFSAPYVCLHLCESYIHEKGEYIAERYIAERFKPFEGYKWFEDYEWFFKENDRPLREGIMWKYVREGDWDCHKNFFKNSLVRAANSEKLEEIVEQFVRMIDDMAAKIDDTMKNLGRNA